MIVKCFKSSCTTLWILAVTFLFPRQGISQYIQSQAISYAATLDLSVFDPVYYELTDSDTTDVYFEVDVYFTSDNVKTITRVRAKPSDYEALFTEVLYNPASVSEAFVDDGDKKILHVQNVATQIMKLREKKKILGYRCRAYLVVDYRGVRAVAFVAKKLSRNISPFANMNLPGTALEIVTSNGFHYLATDFSQGKLPPTFFSLPTDYQIKTISTAAGD